MDEAEQNVLCAAVDAFRRGETEEIVRRIADRLRRELDDAGVLDDDVDVAAIAKKILYEDLAFFDLPHAHSQILVRFLDGERVDAVLLRRDDASATSLDIASDLASELRDLIG